MLIHIVGSMRHFDDDNPFMQKISETIQANGDGLVLNWYKSAQQRHISRPENELPTDLQEMVHDNEEAVVQADGVIIEGSRYNFSQGYHTALALQYEKPVLNLYRKNLMEYKEWPDKNFVVGVSNPLFTSIAYENEADIERIVTAFLNDIRPTTEELNVALTLEKQIYTQLNAVALKSGRSKASIVKDIITQNFSDN